MSKRWKNKKEKVLLSPSPLSGSAQFLSLPGLFFLLLFSLRGLASGPRCAARRALPSSLQPLTGQSRAPYHRQVGPSGQGRLRPQVRAGHEPSRNHRVRFRASIPTPPVSSPLYTRPDPRKAPTSTERQPPHSFRRNSPSRFRPRLIHRCSASKSP